MKFEKISYEQFLKDFELEPSILAQVEYEELLLPKRATHLSAGYDFYAQGKITLCPGQFVRIPTGVKVKLDPDKCLTIIPRSGLGFKHGMALRNTIGLVDADYYNNPTNDGHIWMALTYPDNGGTEVTIERGQAMAQGIIHKYYVTEDDQTSTERIGGFGSTT